MADTSTFPTLTNVLVSGKETVKTYTAGAAIKAGQLVAFNTTGVGQTVQPAIAGTTYTPAGVAIFDAASGAPVAVATDGAQVYVCEGAGAAIDAGDFLVPDDCAVGGCVGIMDPAIGSHSATVTAFYCGVADTDIAANSTGIMTIKIGPMETASS